MTDVSADETAAEETGATSAAPRARRFSGKKIFLFLILPAVLVVAVMFGLPMFEGEEAAETHVESGGVPAHPTESFYYDLPDLLVNLNTQGKQPRYLKLEPFSTIFWFISVNCSRRKKSASWRAKRLGWGKFRGTTIVGDIP